MPVRVGPGALAQDLCVRSILGYSYYTTFVKTPPRVAGVGGEGTYETLLEMVAEVKVEFPLA